MTAKLFHQSVISIPVKGVSRQNVFRLHRMTTVHHEYWGGGGWGGGKQLCITFQENITILINEWHITSTKMAIFSRKINLIFRRSYDMGLVMFLTLLLRLPQMLKQYLQLIFPA
jgi:hypothetical protein